MKKLSKTHIIIIIIVAALAAIVLSNVLTPDGKRGEQSESFTTDLSLSLTEKKKNVYAIREHISVDAPITGDVYAIASTLTVADRMVGDIGFLGDVLTVQESVNGDVRALANKVSVYRVISSDVLFLGSHLTLGNESVVWGDVSSTADETVLQGIVHGDVTVSGKNLIVQGTVLGNIDATDVRRITIGEGAVVKGSITYTKCCSKGDKARQSFSVDESAIINGEIIALEKKKGAMHAHRHVHDILETLVFLIAGAFLMYGLFMRRSGAFTRTSLKKNVVHVFVGLGSVVASIIAMIILLFIPGMSPIALIIPCVAMFFVLLGIFATPVLVGTMVQRLFQRGEPITPKTVFTGIAITFIFMTLLKPISLFAYFIFTFLFVGYLVRLCIKRVQGGR